MSENKITAEILISNILRVGLAISVACILVGLAMFVVSSNSGYMGATFPTSIPEILKGFFLVKPYAIILSGLLILVLTPVFWVGASIIAFLKEKDYLYAGIAGMVFLILLVGFLREMLF